VNAEEYDSAVSELTFGKRLPNATYVYAPSCDDLPPRLAAFISGLRTRFSLSESFNVLKLCTDFTLSFLRYPTFLQDPHPVLAESVRVNLATGKSKRILYEGHTNPPILHRKECFLPPAHPDIPRFARLTKQEEDAGLFANPRSIGFQANWEKLLRSKNLAYADHDLQVVETGQAITPLLRPVTVHRYRTAISRNDLSKPIREALANGLLIQGQTVFDYGCGLGDDACNLRALGYQVAAWDPAHCPDGEKRQADFVNLGYVLNVIEDPAERVDVLLDAWTFAQRVLLVSTLIEGNELYNSVRHHSDGILTRRDTFQKYFAPAEIQGLIESALDVEAHTVSTGIYVVFRDTRDAQAFLSSRSRRQIDWEQLSRRLGHVRREPRSGTIDLYAENKQLLDDFWMLAIDLGRLPRPGEFERETELRDRVGTPKKALRLFTDRFGADTYEAARRQRRDDLLVYLALANFRKPIPLKHLGERLRNDLEAHFGTYKAAQADGLRLLLSLKDSETLLEAIASVDVGYFDEPEGHFSIHRSVVETLPAPLRVFIDCGCRLYGTFRDADIIKIHARSHKLTLLTYDDFDADPIPVLKTRVKIDLARLQVQVFETPVDAPEQRLFFKERFLPQTHPDRGRMAAVSETLRSVGITADSVIGNEPTLPPAVEMPTIIRIATEAWHAWRPAAESAVERLP
jgi:DNA phosphorothioation-associated putative methyltransferase